jgi:hypothetical protein
MQSSWRNQLQATNDRPGLSRTRHKATAFPLLNVATAGFVVAWLAVACYAAAYLLSH